MVSLYKKNLPLCFAAEGQKIAFTSIAFKYIKFTFLCKLDFAND